MSKNNEHESTHPGDEDSVESQHNSDASKGATGVAHKRQPRKETYMSFFRTPSFRLTSRPPGLDNCLSSNSESMNSHEDNKNSCFPSQQVQETNEEYVKKKSTSLPPVSDTLTVSSKADTSVDVKRKPSRTGSFMNFLRTPSFRSSSRTPDLRGVDTGLSLHPESMDSLEERDESDESLKKNETTSSPSSSGTRIVASMDKTNVAFTRNSSRRMSVKKFLRTSSMRVSKGMTSIFYGNETAPSVPPDDSCCQSSQNDGSENLKKHPDEPLTENSTSVPSGSSSLTVMDELKYKMTDLLKQGKKDKLNPRTHRSNVADLAIHIDSSISRTHSFQQGVNKKQRVHSIVQNLEGPLYQFYIKNSTQGEQEVEKATLNSSLDSRRESAISSVIDDIMEPEQQQHSNKTWSSMPQVISSPILKKLSEKEIKLQEAKFEIFTSEASYYRSLLVLQTHFGWSKQFLSILSKTEYNYLFGHIQEVRNVSEKVLRELSKCFEDSILMTGLSYKLVELVRHDFRCYLIACTKQPLVERTLTKLSENGEFAKALKELESSPKCHKLPFNSFLILPMQRILRMPLLVESIIQILSNHNTEFRCWQETLKLLKKLAIDCNEACGNISDMEVRMTQLSKVIKSLHFSVDVQPLGLLSSDRSLELEDLFTYINSYLCDQYLNIEPPTHHCHAGNVIKLFLFNDYLLVTKATGNNQFLVLNHCHRDNSMVIHDPNDECSLTLTLPASGDYDYYHEVWVLQSSSVEKRDKWWNVLPSEKEDFKEDLVKSSGSSQTSINTIDETKRVEAKYAYVAQRPDELDLEVGDDIILMDECDDGWSYGERLRDSQKGYFPGNYV